MKKKIRVGVVGCGNAAAWIDKKSNKIKNNPFSHMSILFNNNNFEIVACCDLNDKKLKLFAKTFKIKNTYVSIKKMLYQNCIDLLLICSPTEFHYQHSRLALYNKSVKAVICEKPFGFNYKKARILFSNFKKKKKLLIISYQRRWDKFYNNIRKYVSSKKLGKLISIIAHVDKALFQNSSHMIDLVVSLGGKVSKVNGFFDKTFQPRLVHNYKDYGGYIFIKHKNNIVSFIKASTDDVFKKYFELELNFSNGRILIKNDNEKFELYKFRNSNFFKGYKQLSLEKEFINKFNSGNRLKIMYNFILKFFKNKNIKAPFDLYETIEPLKILNKLR